MIAYEDRIDQDVRRDTEMGVPIEFLISGEYPGDGKPKPVAFPHPSNVSTVIDGKRLQLPKLIELQLASGLSNPRRARDLVDVQEMIDALKHPVSLAEQLDPYVQEKYRELYKIIQEYPE